MMEWYTIKNLETLDTPALILYPDRIKENLRIVKTFVKHVSGLRPHVKTSKSAEVVKLMLETGITRFKCATIAEAEMLALQDAKDVLLAYQPVGPKAKRFCELQKNFRSTDFSCLIDNPGSLSELSVLAQAYDQPVREWIDLNVGMNRTGIASGKEAFNLYRAARETRGIEFTGLHAYDGHLRDADLTLRARKCDESYQGVEALREEISRDWGKEPRIVAGGTPSFPIHAKRPGVEASPGTFIFWDKGYQQSLTEQPFELAALVITRVISKPDAVTVCVDLGHKSVASENPMTQRVYFLNAPGLTPIGHSEEHLVLRTDGKTQYEVGDVLYGVPHHICPTVALYDEARVCTQNVVGKTWPILARKRKINI